MNSKKIKIFGDYYFTNNNKMSIDNNLFFDLNKVSFISDENFFENPLNDGTFELSFYFSFILDGLLFEVYDKTVVNYKRNPKIEIEKAYNSILVFKLRKIMLERVFY